MQSLTAGGLTEEQALRLLTGAASVRYGRGVEVLDSDLSLVEDISGDLAGGKVSRSMRATVHGTCDLTLARDVKYGSQLLRPYMTLTNGELTGRWYAGAYVPRKPATAYGESVPSNQISGSDRVLLLNRPVGDAYPLPMGAPILGSVRQAIVDAGLSASTVLLAGDAQDATLPAPKVWPLLAEDSTATDSAVTENGAANATTWLRIVNDLLAMVTYRGISADPLGRFQSGPYADPTSRPVEFAFDFDDLLRSIVGRQRSVTQDFSTVPNVWIFRQSNLGGDYDEAPPEPTEGAGQYTVRNTDDGPASIDARGGLEFPVVIELDAASQADLEAQGLAKVAADKRVTRLLDVSTAPFPVAWHWDIYTYADAEMGGRQKVQSVKWDLDLGSGDGPPPDMQHQWEAVG